MVDSNPPQETDYDDDRELTAYIWRNYLRFLSPDESLGYKALIGTSKAESASPAMARWLRERWGDVGDPVVSPMFADGSDVFRDRVRDRILREHADDVFVNRCDECSKIVVTPEARQCLWCGCDWH